MGYLNQDSYFKNEKGEIFFFEKGTDSSLYEHLQRFTPEEQQEFEAKAEFKRKLGERERDLAFRKQALMSVTTEHNGFEFQTDTNSLTALNAALNAGIEPITWYSASNEPVELMLSDIREIIASVARRNSRIVSDTQKLKKGLRSCKKIKDIEKWERENGIK